MLMKLFNEVARLVVLLVSKSELVKDHHLGCRALPIAAELVAVSSLVCGQILHNDIIFLQILLELPLELSEISWKLLAALQLLLGLDFGPNVVSLALQ